MRKLLCMLLVSCSIAPLQLHLWKLKGTANVANWLLFLDTSSSFFVETLVQKSIGGAIPISAFFRFMNSTSSLVRLNVGRDMFLCLLLPVRVIPSYLSAVPELNVVLGVESRAKVCLRTSVAVPRYAHTYSSQFSIVSSTLPFRSTGTPHSLPTSSPGNSVLML